MGFICHYILDSECHPYVTQMIEKTGVPLDFSYFFALIGLSIVNRLWWLLYSLLRGFR